MMRMPAYDPPLITLALSDESIRRLQRLRVFECLVGKWPAGNQSLEEVVESLHLLVHDPEIVVRMAYRYPPDNPDASDLGWVELLLFTIHSAVDDTKYVDVLKQFDIQTGKAIPVSA